jgi:hypothetical protein
MPPTNPSIIGISQFASNSRLHQSIVESYRGWLIYVLLRPSSEADATVVTDRENVYNRRIGMR